MTSIVLIAIIALAHLAQHEFIDKFSFHIGSVRKGEYHRILTPFLVHSGWVHLLMNAMGIYYFAPTVEYFSSPTITYLIFLLSVIGGSLYTLALRFKDKNYLAVGASGGVSGLVMFTMFADPHSGIGLFLIPVYLPAYIFGIIFVWASIILSQTGDRERISHEGHLGGLLFGGCFPALFFTLDPSAKYLLYFGLIPMILFPIFRWMFPRFFYKK